MQAASALLANAISAPGGDGAAAPDAAGGGDAFTSALAALMGVLGQAQPAARDPTAAAPSGTAAFAPGAGAAAAMTVSGTAGGAASAAPGPLSGSPASGVLADTLQVLDAVVTELEAAEKAMQAAGASGRADATAAAAADAAGSGAASAAGPEDQLAALLGSLAGQANDDSTAPSAAAASGGDASGGDASPPDPSLDPRLIRFVARGAATPPGDATTPGDAGSPAAGEPAANAAPTGDPTAGAANDAPAADASGQAGAVTAPPAQPAAGLIVFNPAGGQPAPTAQPAAARPNSSKSTAAPAAGAVTSAKPASAPAIKPVSLALFDATRDSDAPAVGGDDGQPAGDGAGSGNQSSDQSAGAPPPAFSLAGAPGAAAQAPIIPPAAAALAQAHGAEITAQLAAQIAARSGAVRSSFDFSLDPQGLGRVDVALKIDAQGGLSAVLSFDNPAVAAEARSRAGDLQQALQQAGFDIGQSGLSFTTGGGQGHGAAFQGASQPSYAAAHPSRAEPASPESPAITASLARGSALGALDITI